MSKLKDSLTDQLFEAILLLKTEKECYKFFEDICTVSELKSLAQRLEVARMLKAGRTYEEIVTKTTVSTATIARVKRCLDYGTGGYPLVLKRMQANGKDKDNAGK